MSSVLLSGTGPSTYKGVLKAFNSGIYTATVQIEGSLSDLEHKLKNLNKEKSLALEEFDIKVLAWPDRPEFQGAISSYVTIAQTWGRPVNTEKEGTC